jgi:lipopolysaccharide transport system ATP-binding protein
MSSDTVISVEGLSKSYLVGHQGPQESYQSLRDTLVRHGRNYVRKAINMAKGNQIIQGDSVEEFWALRDVSFEVKRGEVLGIIGRNGAGKSTLLKILSRITEPTSGRVTLDGRIASLLEVGTGFHPELTGRENIFLNGAILGMAKEEIRRKFDEIVDFAEVEQFLDTPVKRYSSGMYVRLAFAVAAHLEPEILVIDEVLAVGDVVFQKKCLGKMQGVAKSGKTVIFVSHNMQTVTALTERCVLLQAGRVADMGASAQMVESYLTAQTGGDFVYEGVESLDGPAITRVELNTSHPENVQQFGRSMSVIIEIKTPQPILNSAISFQVMSTGQFPVVNVLNLDSETPMLRSSGRHVLRCDFPNIRLYPGHYYLRFYFGASDPKRVFNGAENPVDNICPFEVCVLENVRDYYWSPNDAFYVEDVEWNCSSIDNQAPQMHNL